MFRSAIRRWFSSSQVGHLWETPPAGGAPAGDAGGAGGGAPAPAVGGGAPAGGAPAGGGAPTGAAPAGKKTYTFEDDRTKWIPPHRLKEESDGKTKAEQRAIAAEAERETLRKQVQALTGVQPQDPNAAETEKIRDAFFALPGMSHYKELTPERMKNILAMLDSQGAVESAVNQQWETLAANTFAAVHRKYAETIGSDPDDEAALSDVSKQFVNQAFVAFVRSDPAYKPRYDRSDPKLIDEFMKTLDDGILAPVRRQATAGAVNRSRPVPRPGHSAPVRSDGQPKITDYTNMQQVEDAAVARLKEAGMLSER